MRWKTLMAVMLCVLSAGCGQKGPLVLPEAASAPQPVPVPKPAQ